MGFYGISNPNPITPQFAFPRRGGVKLSGTCIIHTAESALDVIGDDSGAEDVAAFCMRRSDYGCYHTIVDSDSYVEIYPYEYETWQDSETNNWAVGLSCACRTTDWNTMGPEKAEGFYRNLAFVAADFVTYMKNTYNIDVPLRRLSGQEARDRVPGFAAHGDSGLSRTDPGVDFNWVKFFEYTKQALNGEEDMGHVDSIGEAASNALAEVVAKKILSQPSDYRDPVTGNIDPNIKTNIATFISYADYWRIRQAAGINQASLDISPEDIEKIAGMLKANLSSALASDLAKRLAE